jgi:hypothetical protein
MKGTFAEIQLNGSKRNADVEVLEIKNDVIITSIPHLNGDRFFFSPLERVKMSYFIGQHVYQYEMIFENIIATESGVSGYRFRTVFVELHKNMRQESRRNVSQEAVFLNWNGLEFAHVLDRSNEGLKFQTWRRVKTMQVELNINIDGKIDVVRGEIAWEKEEDGKFFYGLKFPRAAVGVLVGV